MKRNIITIDEKKCTGCGLCIPGCPEGAIQLIDGKARLVSDLFCDGLGACLGHCPEGAISIEEREAELYDERKVMENIVKQGKNTIIAHLNHLKAHNQFDFYAQALAVLEEKNIKIDMESEYQDGNGHGCPGSFSHSFDSAVTNESFSASSQLSHWPIQLHLISPTAVHYQHSNLVLAADCVAYSLGSFHTYLSGRTLAIACPKLDGGQEIYAAKLQALIDETHISSLTVMIMQVPCCRGLFALAQRVMENTKRRIPIKVMVVSINGELLAEEEI